MSALLVDPHYAMEAWHSLCRNSAGNRVACPDVLEGASNESMAKGVGRRDECAALGRQDGKTNRTRN